MCLALPGKLVSKEADEGQIELAGNRFKVYLSLLPEAKVGDWVLAHAGYGIKIVDEEQAREIWSLIDRAQADDGEGDGATGADEE